MVDYTYYNRLEPRPRDNDFRRGLAAEIRDPLWLLTRQWQVGEFRGEDTGSASYVVYAGSKARLPRWKRGSSEFDLDPNSPLEPQTLSEPFQADLSLRVELGHDFGDLLSQKTPDTATATRLFTAFRNLSDYQLQSPDGSNELNPVDPSTTRFLLVCMQSSVDGFKLYKLGLDIANGTRSVPSDVTTNSDEVGYIEAALADLVTRVADVFGSLSDISDPSSTKDPVSWDATNLEYQVSVIAPDPAGSGRCELRAYPDSDGEFDWFSFDVASKDANASESAHEAVSRIEIPNRIRFTGMPSTRFWNFEENTLSLPDIVVGRLGLPTLVAIDFLVLHCHDWYRIPYLQEPGTLAKTDHLTVHDVFGKATVVYGANSGSNVAPENRWSLFSVADDLATSNPPADYFIVPPSGGAAMKLGSVLEDVRFARDEMANMAWAIERTTVSPIGEPRSGRERNAEIDASRNPPPATPTTDGYPLRYSIESEVPANFVPLFPKLVDPSSGDPTIYLRRGEMEKATTNDGIQPVPVVSVILNPDEASVKGYYDINENEVSRTGLKLERVVYRTRWYDGRTHLWVQRRRSIGAGEAQSGLQFDQALPNEV